MCVFVVSYQFDVQLVEGALTASRALGFHMADLNSALQVMLAFKHVVLNLVIGTLTVFVLWFLLGGRAFCSWVCPYHLIAEWAEKIHLWLRSKGVARDVTFHRGTRTFWVIFALLAYATRYTVFEVISPTGILSRALIYGPALALLWVGMLLVLEILVSRRAWCRYVCPIGLTYGLVGVFSPFRVSYSPTDCAHEGDCRKACLVPHVLDVTIKGRATDLRVPIGADCTRCGLCVDARGVGLVGVRAQRRAQRIFLAADDGGIPAICPTEKCCKLCVDGLHVQPGFDEQTGSGHVARRLVAAGLLATQTPELESALGKTATAGSYTCLSGPDYCSAGGRRCCAGHFHSAA